MLLDEIQSGSEMPSEVRLRQGLQYEVGEDEREKGIQSEESRMVWVDG